jgi:nicotinate-nucleotide adenylyltransferase
MKLGIIGGTFNPVHIGHLIIAQTTVFTFNLDKILFIPTYRPPHKNFKPDIPDEARLEMLNSATMDNPFFETSDIEYKRKGKSYSIDTIQYFYKQFPVQDKIFFVIGADLLFDLHTWKNIDELINLVCFVVHDRDNNKAQDLIGIYKQRYPNLLSANNMVNVDINSTLIRQRIKQGLPIKYLVPDPVEKLIETNQYYTK